MSPQTLLLFADGVIRNIPPVFQLCDAGCLPVSAVILESPRYDEYVRNALSRYIELEGVILDLNAQA